jgi:hypothetical protein
MSFKLFSTFIASSEICLFFSRIIILCPKNNTTKKGNIIKRPTGAACLKKTEKYSFIFALQCQFCI